MPEYMNTDEAVEKAINSLQHALKVLKIEREVYRKQNREIEQYRKELEFRDLMQILYMLRKE